jgi:hypothetical protein
MAKSKDLAKLLPYLHTRNKLIKDITTPQTTVSWVWKQEPDYLFGFENIAPEKIFHPRYRYHKHCNKSDRIFDTSTNES